MSMSDRWKQRIGFAIVRALCKQFHVDVILTSRDEGRGRAAVKKLEKENLKPKYHQLDIEDQSSIVGLADYLKNTYGGLDVLVNNAAIDYMDGTTVPTSEQAPVIMKCNFYATLNTCRILFPCLRPHARVCNISSRQSQRSLSKCSDAVKARFVDPGITMDELKSLVAQFVETAKDKRHESAGFSDSAYGMSKIGVTVMSIIQQRELDSQGAHDIIVNACCPGYVSTEQTSYKGHLTPDQGAETPTYCATLPLNIERPRGNLIREKKISPWQMKNIDMYISCDGE